MSLIDFLKEEREERKKRKQLQKEQKRKKKTPEEKKRKVFSIIIGCIITFGAIFYTCSVSSRASYDWKEIIGITDEMVVELEKPINVDELVEGEVISYQEWNECKDILAQVGVDLDKDLENIVVEQNFSLTDRQLGALSKELFKSTQTISMQILDLEIYSIGERFYEKCVVKIDLSQVIKNSDLPEIYLTNTSEVSVLNNELFCLSNDIRINNIAEDVGDKIVETLNKSSNTKLESLTNEMINASINVFVGVLDVNMYLAHGGIDFEI